MFDVNFASRSKIMALDNPCSQNISFIKNFAMLLSLYVDLTGIKCASLVNLSTTTIMESCFLVFMGSPIIKSIEITFHFHYGRARATTIMLYVTSLP